TVSHAQMRLMAKAHRMYSTTGNIIEDSVRYFHSGTKGSSAGKYKIPEFELMEDSMHVFTKSGTGVKWTGRRVSTYTGTDFDQSIYYTWSDSANNWRNSLRTRIKYKSAKPDTVFYDSWGFGNNWRSSSCMVYTWSSNNVATCTRLTYSFGGGGNPPGWRFNRRWSYAYSGNNETELIEAKYSGGNWVDSFKRTTTYTTGRITDVSTYKYSGGNWLDDTKSTYAYDGNSRLLTIKRDIYVSVWEPNRIDTFIYVPSNSNYADTMVRYSFFLGNFLNDGKYAYKRLYDGRPTELLSMSWDNTQWKQTNNQDSIDNWYYNWGVNVEKVESLNNNINIYPSPANNTIHIKLDVATQDKHVQFAIMDMQGRVVKNWSEYSKDETTMTVNELPSGNYILQVEDGSFRGVRKFTISR
ncbi:MAG TPA: T9SS type A sorting domain-containing protein, partial [Flavipsychrobacter sp.]